MNKTRSSEDSKIKILEAAEIEFAEFGLDGASVNIIAEKSGLNKRMIYHYFNSKEGLYEEILKINFYKIFELEKKAFSMTEFESDIFKSIRQGISDYYNFLKINPKYVKIITREELSGGKYIHKLIPDTFLMGFEKLLGIYKRGVEKDLLKENIDIMQLIISINAMCFIPFTRSQMLKEIWGTNYGMKLNERLEHICQMVINEISKERKE